MLLNLPKTRTQSARPFVAKTGAEYAAVMNGAYMSFEALSETLVAIEGMAHEALLTDIAIANTHGALVAVEAFGMTPEVINMLNNDGGLAAMVGNSATTTPRTQAERNQLKMVATEGFKKSMSKAWAKLKEWFQRMWNFFKTLWTRLFNYQRFLASAVETQKERIKKLTDPKLPTGKVNLPTYANWSKFADILNSFVDNIAAAPDVQKISAAQTKVEGLESLLETKNDTYAKLGWTADKVMTALTVAGKIAENFKNIRESAKKAQVLCKASIATMSASGDIAEQKKADIEKNREAIMAASKAIGFASRKAPKVVNVAIRVAKATKGKTLKA